jgi:chorismate-pyruvate lyase
MHGSVRFLPRRDIEYLIRGSLASSHLLVQRREGEALAIAYKSSEHREAVQAFWRNVKRNSKNREQGQVVMSIAC